MTHFLKEFLAHPAETAAVCPSSLYLAEVMAEKEKLSRAKCVVELGSGTGVITEKIVEKLSPGCTFFALEINPAFAKITKKKFPHAAVYQDSAENIQKYLRKHQAKHCNVIISSLPWACFERQEQTAIFDSVYRSLSAEGKMIAYAYMHGIFFPGGRQFRKLLKGHFSEVKTKIVWKNIPPALVYECKK